MDKHIPQPWQARSTLVFALGATAIAFGNFYRLPFLLGEHGGAPFFVIYLITVFAFSAPVLAAEVVIGSYGRGSPVGSIRWLADQAGRWSSWSWLAYLQAVLALIIACKLLVLTVYALDRAVVLNSGSLAAASANDVAASFLAMVANPRSKLLISSGLLLAMLALVLMGPRHAMKFLGWLGLPSILLVGISLVNFSFIAGDLVATKEFLYAAKWTSVSWSTVQAAVISAMFSLGAGLGVGIAYGARAPRSLPLLRSTAAAVVIDGSMMMLIALVIVPLLFATNTEVTEGLALIFVAVPHAYANVQQGDVYGALFYGLVALVGVGGMVALLEPAVMILRRDFHWQRYEAVAAVAATMLSFVWLLLRYAELPWADVWRYTDTVVMTGMLILAVFVAWRVPRPILRGELYREPRWLFMLWWLLLRWWVPVLAAMAAVWIALHAQ